MCLNAKKSRQLAWTVAVNTGDGWLVITRLKLDRTRVGPFCLTARLYFKGCKASNVSSTGKETGCSFAKEQMDLY